MKKRILALLLCLGLLPLGGCAAMLERGHVSSADHVDYAVEDEDESILRAESYAGLVNSILYMVDGHRGGGTIRLYHYAGDVEADLAAAREAVLQTPMGAYAVGTLDFESTRILTYYEVELSLAYSRSVQEMNALRDVATLSGVRQELGRLVKEQRGGAVFLASYFSGDQALLEALLDLACFSAPELYRHHRIGSKDISLYPETGTRRVIEVKLAWNQAVDTVASEERDYAQLLEAAAAALLEANLPAGEAYTVEELAAIVRTAAGERAPEGSILALDALSGEPASDFALLMAMEYLCQQCGVEVQPVSGSAGLWLIVATAEGYRHLLPQGLRRPEEGEGPGGEPPQLLYTDQELAELGYEWPTALHPACEDYGSAEPS